jgi:hypothetical protein
MQCEVSSPDKTLDHRGIKVTYSIHSTIPTATRSTGILAISRVSSQPVPHSRALTQCTLAVPESLSIVTRRLNLALIIPS